MSVNLATESYETLVGRLQGAETYWSECLFDDKPFDDWDVNIHLLDELRVVTRLSKKLESELSEEEFVFVRSEVDRILQMYFEHGL